jgi:hypothetical protein
LPHSDPLGEKRRLSAASLFFVAPLDLPSYFCNYRTMEEDNRSDHTGPLPCRALHSDTSRRNVNSVLTDAVVSGLKRQYADGCLLCSLDACEEEEWD